MVTQRKLDPVLFEILRHRMEEIVAESYYTMARVSGNPVITEAGDHEEAILNAQGDTVMVGGGIVEWTGCLEDAGRFISREYEDNPGINDGDQFILNDTEIAAVHHMDIEVLKPVFWEGKRIAWVNAAGHMMDVGGMEAGGFMLKATDRMQEGLCMRGIKICDRGVVKRDVEQTLKYMTRQPDIFMLEISARMAANNAASKRLLETVEEFGIDKVMAVFEELPEYSERLVRARLRSLPDGVYTAVHYFDSTRDEEGYLKIKCTLTKRGGNITMDFTGSSPQSKGSQNIAAPGAKSNAECPFLIMLGYDIPWNWGLWRVINFVLPEGTVVNPTSDGAVSANTCSGAGYVVIGVVADCISQMYLCSGQKTEAFANGSNAHVCPVLYGEGKRGELFMTMMMELMISGAGAEIDRDGDDTCSNMWTAKPQVTNIEREEELFPLLYLWRKECIDSGGPGKFRGGCGCEDAIIPWGTKEIYVHPLVLGQEPRLANGLIGGYPAPHVKQLVMRNSNVSEMFRRGEMPNFAKDIQGEQETKPALRLFSIGAEDVYVIYHGGGGGCGDPLEREPKAVARDVRLDYVSLVEAKRTYGVVLEPDTLEINLEGTQKLRQEMLQERLNVGKK